MQPPLPLHRAEPIRRLATGQVDVWLTRLDSKVRRRVERYEALLDESELERRRLFKSEDAALQHLVGRALLRCTLSRYAEVSPPDWRFAANEYGCPTIASPPGAGLAFNSSHTEGLVACAVTRGIAVGVDVERIEQRVEIEALASLNFAPAEAEAVANAPPDARVELFFALWTLKEAYIKARGMGLALPLDGFAFDLSGPEPRIVFSETCPGDPKQWTFRRVRATPDHRLAVAICCPADRVKTEFRWTVPLDEDQAEHALEAEGDRMETVARTPYLQAEDICLKPGVEG